MYLTMQTENLSPTPYDTELAETVKQVEAAQQHLENLQEKAKELTFKAITDILDIKKGEVADFRFPDGTSMQHRLTGADYWGNAIFTPMDGKANHWETKCIFLSTLREGRYDGVNNPIITKAIE